VLLLVGLVVVPAVVLVGLISVGLIAWFKRLWCRNNTSSAGNDTQEETNVPLQHSVHGDGQVIHNALTKLQWKWKDNYFIAQGTV